MTWFNKQGVETVTICRMYILMYAYIIHAPDTDRDQDELIVVDDDVEEGARDLMELPSR